MTKNIRKHIVVLAGIPADLARVLRPVKETLELITGAGRSREIKGLQQTATDKEIIAKLNEIIRRLNASGGDHV